MRKSKETPIVPAPAESDPDEDVLDLDSYMAATAKSKTPGDKGKPLDESTGDGRIVMLLGENGEREPGAFRVGVFKSPDTGMPQRARRWVNLSNRPISFTPIAYEDLEEGWHS